MENNMAKSSNEVWVQEGEDKRKLTGAELQAFEADRKATEDSFNTIVAEAEKQKQLKIDAYTKLGLTEEEINAIL